MAAITWTDVTTLIPSMSAITVGAQGVYLAHVNVALDVRLFCGEEDPRLKMARIYLAAHFAASDTLAGASGGAGISGPLTSESAGSLSHSYGSTAGGSGFGSSGYGSTAWGRLYLTLIKTTGGGIVI